MRTHSMHQPSTQAFSTSSSVRGLSPTNASRLCTTVRPRVIFPPGTAPSSSCSLCQLSSDGYSHRWLALTSLTQRTACAGISNVPGSSSTIRLHTPSNFAANSSLESGILTSDLRDVAKTKRTPLAHCIAGLMCSAPRNSPRPLITLYNIVQYPTRSKGVGCAKQ